MKSILIILILLQSALCWGADTDNYDESIDVLSGQYVSGGHLIYDCIDQHWVCAMKDNHTICEKKRAQELLQGKHLLSCISAEIFQSYKECKPRQLALVKSGVKPRNCLHPSERQRLIGFQ